MTEAAPFARDDMVVTFVNQSILVNVVANDAPAAGLALALLAVTPAANGKVEIAGAQTIRYTPGDGFAGADSFVYSAGDGVGEPVQAAVRIEVMAGNLAPQARDDRLWVNAGEAVRFEPLANDADADGDPLALVGITWPRSGTVAIEAGQTVAYRPDAGFVGEDAFTYSISDGAGGFATATVTIEVRAANTPPAVTADRFAIWAGESLSFNALANDGDADGDPLRLVSISMPAGGSVSARADGAITYTPAAGFFGIDRFSYALSDGTNPPVDAEITVEVFDPAIGRPFSDRTYFADGYGWIGA